MVFSYYLTALPYRIFYHLINLVSPRKQICFYCAEFIDWQAFKPVYLMLQDIVIVSDKKHILKYFRSNGIPCSRLPVFPKAVIMCRHACHKFPSARIIKIGMRHGPYHFKRMTAAGNYNRFDRYFFTSKDDLREAEKLGVTIGVAIGYPKLDAALKESYDQGHLELLKTQAKMESDKKTLFFSATWSASGMSALDSWKLRVGELSEQFNILISLHPWISEKERQIIYEQKLYVVDSNTLEYMYLSDIVIGDTSSLLAEACALDKPIITWRTQAAKRSLEKIEHLIESFSLQVDNWEQFLRAIDAYLAHPELKAEERKEARELMFDNLDGTASVMAVEEIKMMIDKGKE